MDDKLVAVLLEDLRGQFKGFGDAVRATNEKIDTLAQTTNDKFDLLDRKFDLMASDVAVLKTDMAEVKERVTRVEHVVNGGTPKRPRKK
jgi:outer membrane murein-binding lipoprotein Lpp